MASKVAALREILLAELACEGSLARVLAEVITEVAALLEEAPALVDAAFEVQFYSLGS